jgi:hypothetical protein
MSRRASAINPYDFILAQHRTPSSSDSLLLLGLVIVTDFEVLDTSVAPTADVYSWSERSVCHLASQRRTHSLVSPTHRGQTSTPASMSTILNGV